MSGVEERPKRDEIQQERGDGSIDYYSRLERAINEIPHTEPSKDLMLYNFVVGIINIFVLVFLINEPNVLTPILVPITFLCIIVMFKMGLSDLAARRRWNERREDLERWEHVGY